jgi:hypothetical protein
VLQMPISNLNTTPYRNVAYAVVNGKYASSTRKLHVIYTSFTSGRPVLLHRRELALIESLVRRQGRAKGKWRARSVQAGGGYFASAGFTNFNTNRSLSPIAAYFSRSCVPSR